ncbi:MAG: hypothetical protein COY81_01460 [Candidatus Pacebacteria bacterium CG_4_10_14_0_8_um_filter_43_12]|nr:MAG: hypothetical protein COU66_02790 [Candidatus Pacebacteria bacterium CG10_big_fil_rev_8_21_14_0_10_44_11]PIY79660.1 MAG: hypothetical protein COY81_01460 [Candidatus Pacebacteria bacterium CG_4_10_14_0_8_um_filter_43_12]
MTITYHGHSCFKLRGKRGTVVTDPFDEYVGFSPSSLNADIVTVSHHHPDHDAVSKVTGTARRPKPFIIDAAGEYEIGGISVFGVPSFHDNSQGAERGRNTIFTILIDDVRVCHLGDLGHELTEALIDEIGEIDILMAPVGGVFTIDPAQAVQTVRALEPSLVIPMHYKTELHKPELFGELKTLADFLKEYGAEAQPVDKLEIDETSLPEEREIVVLNQQ